MKIQEFGLKTAMDFEISKDRFLGNHELLDLSLLGTDIILGYKTTRCHQKSCCVSICTRSNAPMVWV